MFLIIMIMFQARGGRREAVQRSHSSGAGTSSVSKRSPFLCNLSPFMFIFLAMYSYSCLETMSSLLFQERANIEKEYAKQLKQWSNKWESIIQKGEANIPSLLQPVFDKVCVEAGAGSKVVGFVGDISIHTRCAHSELLAGSERANVGCKRRQKQLFRDCVLESVHVLAGQLRDDDDVLSITMMI